MFKRFFTVLVVSFLLLPAIAAYADVLIEPSNDFFNHHRSDCIYLGRSFYAVGEDGTVSVKKAPNSNDNIAFIESAEIIYVDYSCLYKGNFWGFAQRYNGWIKLDEFLVLYDYVAFEEEHLDNFYTYKGDYAELKKTRAAVAWSWPGAESPLWTIENIDTTNFRVLYAYKDAQGREWGFVTYLYGSPNIWFCLSDPLNKDIPVFNPAPVPMVWESETAHNDIGESGNPALTLIIILVAILVMGTVILINVLWKPNKSKTGGNGND